MRPRSSTVGLAAVAVAACTAFLVVPRRIIGGPTRSSSDLRRAAGREVARWWRSGSGAMPPSTRHLVDAWRDYHAVKGATALIAGVAFGVLAHRALRSSPVTSSARHMLRLVSGAASTVACAAAVVLVMANIQGAVAPLASLVSLVPTSGGGGFGPVADEIRAELERSSSSKAARTATLDSFVADFGRYHLVLAVVACVLAAALATATIRAIRRRTALAAIGWAGSFAVTMLVLAANVSTAIDPTPAFAAFFRA